MTFYCREDELHKMIWRLGTRKRNIPEKIGGLKEITKKELKF